LIKEKAIVNAALHFYFDPVCPFAWMTSKWVRIVASQRDYRVDWRFISLRIINAHIDYEVHFPPEYEAVHTAGLELLRVASRVRAEYGRDKIGPLYEALALTGRDVGTPILHLQPPGGTAFFGPVSAECPPRTTRACCGTTWSD
jgi:hypothetical protein